MKRVLIMLLLVVVMASTVMAQLPQYIWGDREQGNATYYLGGEHTPAVWTGSDTLAKGSVDNPTRWMQIGYSPFSSISDNKVMSRLNPEIFTFVIAEITSYPVHADNDSGGIGLAWFETAYDTTADRFWNGDSSNFFIDDGTYNPTSDQWRGNPFKRVATDTLGYSYQLKVLQGGFLRLWLRGWNNTDNASILDDSCIVVWELIGEN